MRDEKQKLDEVVSSLELVIECFERKATPRRPFKAILFDLKYAVECVKKQIPKRPDVEDSDRGKCCECPLCGGFIGYMVDCEDECYQDNYCPSCGQNLDWSDEE